MGARASSTPLDLTVGVRLCFAEMNDPVEDQLKRFELLSRFGEDRFFDTLGQAVSA